MVNFGVMDLRGKAIDLSSLSAVKEFASFFDKGYIEALARQTGFISRSTSRLSGEAFLKMMVENIAPRTEWSLNDQCDYLREHFGIDITKQSLDGRYHTFAVAFLKAAYGAVLQKSFYTEAAAIKTTFDSIYLTDSTSFQLPAHLAPFYMSNGGSTSGSSVKIHQTLELLRGFKICDFLTTDGKASDQNYWNSKGFELAPNSLWISDLGYFSSDTFSEVAGAGSFFLCRYKTGTALYTRDKDDTYQPLDIEQYVKTVGAGDGARSVDLYFGKQKIKCRLVAEKAPDGVREQRLKRYRAAHANQSKKAGGWKMTSLKELLCGYNLYLTNASEQQISSEDISLIYGLRWQLELIFKIWKSLLWLDNVGQMSISRFECFLYGRLIFILLSSELMALIREQVRDLEVEVELSEWKTMKLIKKNYALS